jgi:hAT family C-terminal dimerisation region
MNFWKVEGYRWPRIANVALKVFSIPASTAASERNFSVYGFIHSKLRNKLDSKTVDKLVYLKANATQFTDGIPINPFKESYTDTPDEATDMDEFVQVECETDIFLGSEDLELYDPDDE